MNDEDKAFYFFGYQLRKDGMDVKAEILSEVNHLWVTPVKLKSGHTVSDQLEALRARGWEDVATDRATKALSTWMCRADKNPVLVNLTYAEKLQHRHTSLQANMPEDWFPDY